MAARPAPALLPVAAFLIGAGLALHLSRPSVLPAAALAAGGIALGRRTGRALACFALGVGLAGASTGAPDPWLPDPDRPVEVVGVVADHGRRSGGIWRAIVRVESIRQGPRVEARPAEVRLALPGSGRTPPLGSRLRARGYLRPAPEFRNQLPSPPGLWRMTVKSRRFLSVESTGGPLAAASARLRERLEQVLAAAGPGRGVALVRALVLGDAGGLPEAWKRGLRRTGLLHLLAVSGLNVGMVAGAVLLAFAWLPRGPRLVIALGAVALYLLAAGPQPALVRASIMAVLAAVALSCERPPSVVNGLALAAFGLVAQHPTLLRDLGFQLTFGATAGLVLAGPGLAARWTALPGWLARPLAVSAAAQLGVLPWSLPAFHTLTPLAPLLNLAAVPWTALALLAAFCWLAIGMASPEAARELAPVLDLLAAPFGWPHQVRGTVRFVVPLAAGPGGAALLAAGLFATARWPRLFLAPGLAALVALVAVRLLPLDPSAGALGPEVVMLDVGQGDSILLRDGPRAVLVDGGGWEGGDFGGSVLLPALLGEGVRRLDAAVLSHGDADHCRGLVDLADYLPIGEVWAGAGASRTPCGAELLGLPGLRRRVMWEGEGASVGAWSFLALHPRADERLEGNEGSLVLLARAHGRGLLLTGDIGASAERSLVRRRPAGLAASVLKVAHHGSRTSSSPAFLEAVDPRLALVSAGRRNRYHHPSPQVVDRLASRGAWVLRTDRDGAVRVRFGRRGRLAVGVGGGR